MAINAINGFKDWNYEENMHFLKSFIGSVVEFRESLGGKHQRRLIGTIVTADGQRLDLKDAEIDGQYFGNYSIHENEIIRWKVRKYRQIKTTSATNHRDNSTTNESSKVFIPTQLNGHNEEEEPNEELLEIIDPEVEEIDLNEDDDPIEVDVQHMTQKTSNELKLIQRIDDNFNAIIDTIMAAKCVGFELFGHNISREGSVYWMAFATEEAIYVFDARNSYIVMQLKPLLESELLRKCMFSCRLPSDALFHIFGIELKNVYDVRIFDFGLQKRQTEEALLKKKYWKRPQYRSFEHLLSLYLSIKCPNLYTNTSFEYFSVRIQNIIKIKTIFLRELFAIIVNKLIGDVFLLAERSLRSLRTAGDLEYIAMKNDELEQQLIDCPINESEEMEREVIDISTLMPTDRQNGTKTTIPLVANKSKSFKHKVNH